MAKKETTPTDQRFGVLAVQQKDGSFTAVRIGNFPGGPREMSDKIRPYQNSKRAKRLVRRGHVEELGPTIAECIANGEAPEVIVDEAVLLDKLKELGGRYAAVRRSNDTRFHVFSLNDVREIFATKSVTERTKNAQQES